jgi:hypothetical protein
MVQSTKHSSSESGSSSSKQPSLDSLFAEALRTSQAMSAADGWCVLKKVLSLLADDFDVFRAVVDRSRIMLSFSSIVNSPIMLWFIGTDNGNDERQQETSACCKKKTPFRHQESEQI